MKFLGQHKALADLGSDGATGSARKGHRRRNAQSGSFQNCSSGFALSETQALILEFFLGSVHICSKLPLPCHFTPQLCGS